jgi:hypothetical protein
MRAGRRPRSWPRSWRSAVRASPAWSTGDGSERRRVDLKLTELGQATLARADAEAERRLDEIAAHGEKPAAELFAGLDAWREALNEYRSVRHGHR